ACATGNSPSRHRKEGENRLWYRCRCRRARTACRGVYLSCQGWRPGSAPCCLCHESWENLSEYSPATLNMKTILVSLSCLCFQFALAAQDQPIAIRAGLLLDGKGGAKRNVTIMVRDGKIAAVGETAGPATYDLSKL